MAPTKRRGGTIGKGETVRIAHFKQELPEFDEDMRVLDYIREDHSYMVLGDGSTLSAGQILERFLFYPRITWCTDSKTLWRGTSSFIPLKIVDERP